MHRPHRVCIVIAAENGAVGEDALCVRVLVPGIIDLEEPATPGHEKAVARHPRFILSLVRAYDVPSGTNASG